MTDLLLARTALRDALRPKRILTAVLLILLPAAIGLLWRSLTPASQFVPEEVYDSLVIGVVFGFTLTILSVIAGTGVVGQEMEQRTIVYLLTRPVPRWRILLAKFFVSFLVTAAICIVATLLLALAVFGPTHFSEAGVWPDIRALLIGSLAYGSLFLLLGAMLPRPLIYGLIFAFGWETFVPKMPGSFARVSIMTYLRVLASRETTDVTQTGEGSPSSMLLSFTQPPDLEITNNQAWLILGIVSAVAVLLSILVFSTREYTPRDDSE